MSYVKDKCWHINYRDIFNSEIGCAYCMDCGKAPLSYNDIAYGIMRPGTLKASIAIGKDLLKTCPEPNCNKCNDIRKMIKEQEEELKQFHILE